jgi:hypothetical protein
VEQDLSIFCKTAGARAALEDLGFEKQAIFATLAKPLGWIGKKIVGAAAKRNMPRLAAGLETVGKGMGTDAMMFGTLGGGLSAATAPEGERGKAFARGFLGGAAGGAAWAGGQNIARAGMKGALGKLFKDPGKWEALREAGKSHRLLGLGGPTGGKWYQPWRGGGTAGERLKRFGTRIGTGAPLLAGGYAASELMPHEIDLGGALASNQQNQLPFRQQPQRYASPALAAGQTLYYG